MVVSCNIQYNLTSFQVIDTAAHSKEVPRDKLTEELRTITWHNFNGHLAAMMASKGSVGMWMV